MSATSLAGPCMYSMYTTGNINQRLYSILHTQVTMQRHYRGQITPFDRVKCGKRVAFIYLIFIAPYSAHDDIEKNERALTSASLSL